MEEEGSTLLNRMHCQARSVLEALLDESWLSQSQWVMFLVLETMQVVYFIISPLNDPYYYPWFIPVQVLRQYLQYTQLFTNLLANPQLSLAILYSALLLHLLLLLLLCKTLPRLRDQSPPLFQLKIINLYLILLRTLGTIPLLNISFVFLFCRENSSTLLHISCDSPFYLVHVSASALLLLLVSLGLLSNLFLNEYNPFCNNILARQSFSTEVTRLVLKTFIALYIGTDLAG